MKKIILAVLLLMGIGPIWSQTNSGNTIEVTIVDIDSNDGKLMIALYDTEANWLNTPIEAKFSEIKNEKCVATFENIPDGVYAISLFHDENDNDKLDMNFLGIPKEDTGSSNNAPARFGPPKWQDAKFEVKGKSIKQIINL